MPDQQDTNPATKLVASLAGQNSARQTQYTTYRQYYDGDHGTQLTARQRKYLSVGTGQEFNVNYCPLVVDALVERLGVTGFEVHPPPPARRTNSRAAALEAQVQAVTPTTLGTDVQRDLVWDWWTQNRMDAVQNIVHHAAVRDGDSYVVVEWDNEKHIPVFCDEPAWDGTEGVQVHYSHDKRRQIEFASKWWTLTQADGTQVVRCNLYYPDRIEKYSRGGEAGSWTQYLDEGQKTWPIPWVDGHGQPLGVPVVHFKNRDQGYNYGQSELQDVLPVQQALNKAIIDLLAAADTTGFRIYWMLGDDPSEITISPGTWVYSERPPTGEDGASMGYFPGEDLGALIQFKDAFVTEIARVSRTPTSFFQVSGHRPAEGTLKQEEVGLVAKAIKCQTDFGNAWEDAMRVACVLYNAFGAQTPADQVDPLSSFVTQWKDCQTRNARDHLEALKIKRELGVPEEQLWAEMGYSAAEIADMKAQRGQDRAEQATLGGGLLAAFESGGFAGAGPPFGRALEAGVPGGDQDQEVEG